MYESGTYYFCRDKELVEVKLTKEGSRYFYESHNLNFTTSNIKDLCHLEKTRKDAWRANYRLNKAIAKKMFFNVFQYIGYVIISKYKSIKESK